MPKQSPGDRLRSWREWSGFSQEKAAKVIGVTQGCISHLELGKRSADRRASNSIEAATKDWPEGPILSTEWDEWEARDSAA